ncbi:terminase small subunit [Clostridium hydrogenum]|uniref:terminase small subunit n=1 Tax=Clostridium hydrogenum TaxID=2855764 RepID=UPI002E3041ED|nr:terminase small subunit [Clostridium hydrogenum]
MPRQRSPSRDKAFEIYKNHKGNIDLVKIAETLNLSPGTIRGWKNKDQWDNKLNGTLQKKCNKNTERSKHKKVNKKPKKEPMQQEVEEVLNNDQLTDKQRLFCVIYSKCMNATKAYKKVYKCTYETAMVNGSQLLRNAKVKAQIDRLISMEFNKELIKKSLIQKYLDIAFADMNEFMEFGTKEIPILDEAGEQKTDKEGNPQTFTMDYAHFKDSSNVDGTLISEISKGKDGAKIKLLDKMKAMQWLSDHIDLLTEEQRLKCEKLKSEIDKSKNNDSNEPIEIVIKRKNE